MSSVPEPPTDQELTGLADKYEVLVQLRMARDQDAPAPSRETLRTLSRRYPGSLRELDTLGLPELQRRATVARQAADGAPREPWMAWILAFHRLTAAALLVKRHRSAQRRGTMDPGASLDQVAATAGFRLPAELIERLGHPPGGRLTPVVLQELALRFGVAPRELAETLFPSRRRRTDSVH